MPKYHVYGRVEGVKYLGVFAGETREEAIDLALESDAASISLCPHCAKECEEAEVMSAHVGFGKVE